MMDTKQHLEQLDQFMEYYNHNRYPASHFGLTVDEVLHGEIPNKFRFREQIKKRLLHRACRNEKERLEENRNFNGYPLLCV